VQFDVQVEFGVPPVPEAVIMHIRRRVVVMTHAGGEDHLAYPGTDSDGIHGTVVAEAWKRILNAPLLRSLRSATNPVRLHRRSRARRLAQKPLDFVFGAGPLPGFGGQDRSEPAGGLAVRGLV
jgi:hypothetical protein